MSKIFASFTAFCVVCFGALLPSPLLADHPPAEKLLPEKTLLIVKIKSVKEFTESFMNSGFARMLNDEKMAPIVESLYGSAEEAYAQVQDSLGVSLEELRTLFKGELSLALVAEKDSPMSVVLLADYQGNADTANKLLEFGESRAEADGAEIDDEDVDGVSIRSINGGDGENVFYFQKDDSICATNNEELAKLILVRWKQEVEEEVSQDLLEELGDRLEGRTLNKNRKFLNVMKACDPDEDNPPQAIFFADVFELIRSTQSGVAGTALVGILRGLGVDGLLGIGASTTNNHPEYESILHLHVALANPRAGLIKMLAIEPGDLTPEPIIPPNVANYFTTNWNTITSYNEIEKIYDMFNGEGALADELNENFTENFGVDLKEDLLESLDGRISFAQVNVDSGSINGQSVLLSFKLKDPNAFEDIFADLRDGVEELRRGSGGGNAENRVFTAEKYKGMEYFLLPQPPSQEEIERRRTEREERLRAQGQEIRPRRRRVQFQVRRPTPCIGIVGEYLIFSDSVDLMRIAISNYRNPDNVLADDPDYKKLLREIKRQLEGKKPAMIVFQRPEEAIHMLYDAVKSEQTRSAIKDRAEDNPFFLALQNAFVENELPAWDDIAKYFKPSAGVVTNDETGFHFMAFQPKIDEEDLEEEKE